jgi:hypothetical protein
MTTFRSVRWVLLVALLGGACSSILGIEDIHDGPDPNDGEGGETGSGGSSSGKGGASGTSGASGASGSAGKGGSSGASGGTDTGGTGGDAGGGGTGGDGTGGTTGGTGGGGDDPTVHGRIITTWNQPVPNVTVMIGDAEADTNANGEFEIPDVADTYDVKFVLNYDVYGNSRTYAWAYLGLTRRDPALQVYNGLPLRSGDIGVTPTGLTGTDFSNRQLNMALGSPDGMNSYEVSLPAGIGSSGATWQGPETTNVTAHGLLFEHDANGQPTVYRSYTQVLGVLSETDAAMFVLDVPDETVPGGTVAGTVTSTTSSDRTNYVYLRFESHAAMQLVEHYGSTLNPASFTYPVPNVQGGSIEVGAVEGTWSRGPAAVAHRDRLATGQMDVALQIPVPSQQVAPADGLTGVDGTTIFSWTSQAQTFVWAAENVEPSSPYGGMFIVTAEKRVSIPAFTNGFTLLPGDLYEWRIQSHGNVASVDELADPDTGGFDSWAPFPDGPQNPKRGDGSYTISDGRIFTTAP